MVNLRICDLLTGLVPEYGFVFYGICIVRGHMQGSLVGLPILAFFRCDRDQRCFIWRHSCDVFNRLFAI